MTLHEFLIARRKTEIPTFVRVLKALPQRKLDYRPDPRARSAAELAWLLAYEEETLVSLLEKGTIEWVDRPAPATVAEIVAAFEKNAAQVDAGIAKLDAAGWNAPGKFIVGGASVWEAPTGDMLLGYLFDMVHHRGQLCTYLRPMGGKVPSIYGPSADDSGQ
jgi:uncharacterized damage-inducible protein DinB